MPDSVCDSKLLKKSIEQNQEIIRQADKKIEFIVKQIKHGKYPKDGITWIAHMAGIFGQQLWFYKNTASYTDKLKISADCGMRTMRVAMSYKKYFRQKQSSCRGRQVYDVLSLPQPLPTKSNYTFG